MSAWAYPSRIRLRLIPPDMGLPHSMTGVLAVLDMLPLAPACVFWPAGSTTRTSGGCQSVVDDPHRSSNRNKCAAVAATSSHGCLPTFSFTCLQQRSLDARDAIDNSALCNRSRARCEECRWTAGQRAQGYDALHCCYVTRVTCDPCDMTGHTGGFCACGDVGSTCATLAPAASRVPQPLQTPAPCVAAAAAPAAEAAHEPAAAAPAAAPLLALERAAAAALPGLAAAALLLTGMGHCWAPPNVLAYAAQSHSPCCRRRRAALQPAAAAAPAAAVPPTAAAPQRAAPAGPPAILRRQGPRGRPLGWPARGRAARATRWRPLRCTPAIRGNTAARPEVNRLPLHALDST